MLRWVSGRHLWGFTGNDIGAKGAAAFAEALRVNPSLSSLDLRGKKNLNRVYSLSMMGLGFFVPFIGPWLLWH